MHDDSPSSSSLSSPTSSFFFSSTQPSPGFLHSHTPDDALIVPELSLPAQLPQPTAAGPTLGDIRLLVLGDDPDLLITPNPALVDTGEWQDTPPLGRIRVASTLWTHAGAGTAPAPSRNIHIVHLQPQSHKEEEEETWSSYEEVVETLKGIIEAPFREVARVIHPDPSRPTDPFLASLLSSPTSPLFTALVILRPVAPAALAAPGGGGELGWKDLAAAASSSLLPEGDDHTKPDRDTCSANTNTTNAWRLDREGLTKLIAALAPQIPTILFPPITPQYSALSSSAGDDDDDDSADHAISISDLDQPPTTAADTVADPTVQLNEEDGIPDPFGMLSRFVPTSIETLHQGLFASQEILSLIRSEAAERFMRWREAQLVEETIVRIVDESGGVSKRGVKGLDDDDDGAYAYRVQEGFSSLESLASPRPEVEGEGEEKKRFGSLSLRRRQHQQRLLGRRVGRWSGRDASEREYECGMSSDASGPGEVYLGPSSASLGSGRKELVVLGVLGSQHQQQWEQRLGYDIDKAMKWERDSEWMRDVEMHMRMRYSSGQSAPGIAGQGVVGRRRAREGTITQSLQHQHQQRSSGKRSFQEHASSSLHPQSQSYHSSSPSTSYNPAYGYGYQPQHDPTSSIPAPTHGHASYDPLHLPSLLLFSISLLTPLRLRLQSALGLDGLWDALVLGKPGYHRPGVVRMVLVGGFCVGVGVGFCVGVRMG